MDSSTLSLLVEVLYAVAVGVLVGLEREHSVTVPEPDVPPEGHPPAGVVGVRTFTLLAVLGWMTAILAERSAWILPAMLIVVGGLVVGRRMHGPDHGLTTEVAAVVTFALGVLVRVDHRLTVALGLLTTLVLAAKPWTRALVPKLRRVEIVGTLQLLVLLAVVLPILPTEAPDPWGALPPRKIGLFVVLVAGISYVGYVLTRVMGARRSAGLTGIVGGLASSTAVTAAMAQDARRDPGMVVPGQMAALLANTVMCVRVVVVTSIVAWDVASALAPAMATMAAILLVGAGWKWRVIRRVGYGHGSLANVPEIGNPFALVPALKWGLIFCVVLVAAEAGRRYLGDHGLYVAAAASGIADVDAITLAVARQAAEASLSREAAAIAVAVAVTSNGLVKSTLALVAGGVRFGGYVAAFLLAATGAGVVVAGFG